MTLIINAVWGRWAFNVSDRFVSVPITRNNPSGEFDPHSNKSIVIIGSDCWLVMGYTGIAHLNGRPTDQLIAEAASDRADLSGVMSSMWLPEPIERFRYREIRNRIEKTVYTAYSKLSESTKRAHGLKIISSGIQQLPKGAKPVMFEISMKRDKTHAVEHVPRLFQPGNGKVLARGMVNHDILNRMCDRLFRYSDRGGDSPIIFRDIMIEGVVATSKIAQGVSDRVMAVTIDPLVDRKVSAHFYSPDPSAQSSLLAGMNQLEPQFRELASVSTPFVIMPGAIWGPSVGNPGGWAVSTNTPNAPINYEFSGKNVGSKPGAAFMAAQPRRRHP